MSEHWHTQTAEHLTQRLELNLSTGLLAHQWQTRQAEYGTHQISIEPSTSYWRRLFKPFHNPLIYVLCVVVLITGFLQEWLNAGVILVAILINATLGYVQEGHAKKALLSLQTRLGPQAMVRRDGQHHTISAIDIVPGDLVLLSSGDRVPADLRLLKIQDLQVDESALTGATVAVLKQTGELPPNTLLTERYNMAYGGTLVTYGNAQGVVVHTGDATEIRKIANPLAQTLQMNTPLIQQIKGLIRTLALVVGVLAGLTLGMGIWQGLAGADAVTAAVAMAVATIPEGLPAILSIILVIGLRRMANRQAIIQRLPAAETLGSITQICCAKTGILTANQMTVQRIWSGQATYTLTGTGFEPEGVLLNAQHQTITAELMPAALEQCLRIGSLCNNSALVPTNNNWFDPTEGALLTAALKAGLMPNPQYVRLDTLAFESDRQYMATLQRFPDGSQHILVKGSVQQIVRRCSGFLPSDKAPWRPHQVLRQAEHMAADGLRVLAFASLAVPPEVTTLDAFRRSEAEAQLQFVGLQGMLNPPRAEAIRAVATCQSAGIRVCMITGDHALTAQVMAQQLGIAGAAGRVVTGHDLMRMKPQQWAQIASHTAVFARVARAQKQALVTALQAHGEVVAITGDEVTDAPALEQANMGIAMGQAGTEVAREAADMVLADNNFASITAAIKESRTLCDNLSKFITWIVPTSLGQGLVIFIAVGLGVALPILPAQALWLNLTTAMFLGLMLAFEPPEIGIMAGPPRAPKQPILNTETIGRIFSVSLLLFIGAFGLFQWALWQGESLAVARSLAITLFVVVQILFLLNCRGRNTSLWRTPMLSNPWLGLGIAIMLLAQLAFLYLPFMNLLFHSAPLSPEHWLLMGLYGCWVMLMVEGEKSLWRWRRSLLTQVQAAA